MIARLRTTTTQVWHAWRRALPFHATFAAIITLGFWWVNPNPNQGPETVFAMMSLMLVCTMGSWVYAGQSVREDFTVHHGLRRAGSLFWRGLLISTFGLLAFGSPLIQRSLSGGDGQAPALGLGFTLLVGLMAAGSLVLLEWSRRVGTPKTVVAIPAVTPGALAQAAGRVWWTDLKAGWAMVRHVWKRAPHALLAMVIALTIASLALHLFTALFAPLLNLLPPSFALLLALPVFALCPTAAAVMLARGQDGDTPTPSNPSPESPQP